MAKLAIIYWSGTGNTEEMAAAVAAGAGENADLLPVSAVTAEMAAGYDALALGCPAMGAEELEDSEFGPFFDELEPSLSGKSVGLFGSYGWGDGEWMRTWAERVTGAGASLYGNEGIIACGAPGADETAALAAMGAALAG